LEYPHPLRKGILIRRYKRFLADVRWDEGGEETVHCANPGSMKGCAEPGWKILASASPNPDRKLRHTLESVHNGACWIGVNPALANAVAEEGLRAGAVPELAGYPVIEREVRFGEGTRFDFRLSRGGARCFVEVKSVTLLGEDGFSAFPDAPTARGVKHLRELLQAKAEGHRAALLFVVQRSDGLRGFRAASEIDPAYAAALRAAHDAGLEIYAHWAEVTREGVTLTPTRLPILLQVPPWVSPPA
jgi:sugar fermentation stimulation protein A